MLELAQEYGGNLLDFIKKYGKRQRSHGGKVMEYILVGHPVHRS
jgi:hypothetical protein